VEITKLPDYIPIHKIVKTVVINSGLTNYIVIRQITHLFWNALIIIMELKIATMVHALSLFAHALSKLWLVVVLIF